MVMTAALLATMYVTWTLVPAERSPLADMAPADLRAEIDAFTNGIRSSIPSFRLRDSLRLCEVALGEEDSNLH